MSPQDQEEFEQAVRRASKERGESSVGVSVMPRNPSQNEEDDDSVKVIQRKNAESNDRMPSIPGLHDTAGAHSKNT